MKMRFFNLIFLITVLSFHSGELIAEVKCESAGGGCSISCDGSCGCGSYTDSEGVEHCDCSCGGSGILNGTSTTLGIDVIMDFSLNGEFGNKELEDYLNSLFKVGIVVPKNYDTSKLNGYNKSNIKVSSLIEELGVMTIQDYKNESNNRSLKSFIFGAITSTFIFGLIYFFYFKKKNK